MKRSFLAFTALALLLAACATARPEPVRSEDSVPDELDRAIREASDYLNGSVPAGSKLVILNIKSSYPPLSEYIIDVLTGNVVNDRIFTVVDRANLMLIQQEIDFQLSGEVSDESAQSIGQKLGAQTIISGSITAFGDLWRLTIRALGVEGATVQGMFNRNMPNGASIAALTSGRPVAPTPAAPATAVSNGKQQAAQGSDPASAAEPPKSAVYKIGDIGPAGGFICYDKGNYSDGWRYLEAAPADTEKTAVFFKHGNFGTWMVARLDGNNPLLYGMTNKGYREIFSKPEIGYGKQSSEYVLHAIITAAEWDTAIQVCDELVVNGFDDWFLPSLNELSQMYGNLARRGLGGFAREPYWSSTAYSDTFSLGRACYVNFNDGDNQKMMEMAKTARVRAMRQF